MTVSVDPAAGHLEPEATATAPGAPIIQGRSLGQIAWRRLRRDKVAMAGGTFIAFLVVVSIIGPYFVQDPTVYHSSLIDPTFSRPIGSTPNGWARLMPPQGPIGRLKVGSIRLEW